MGQEVEQETWQEGGIIINYWRGDRMRDAN